MCMCVPVCDYVLMCVQVPVAYRRGFRSSGDGIVSGWDLLGICTRREHRSCAKPGTTLNAEPSFYPHLEGFGNLSKMDYVPLFS